MCLLTIYINRWDTISCDFIQQLCVVLQLRDSAVIWDSFACCCAFRGQGRSGCSPGFHALSPFPPAFPLAQVSMGLIRWGGGGGGPISSPSIGGFVDPTRTFPPPRRAPFPTRVLRGSPHLHVASTLRHQRIPPPGPVTYHSEIWPLGSAYLDRSSG